METMSRPLPRRLSPRASPSKRLEGDAFVSLYLLDALFPLRRFGGGGRGRRFGEGGATSASPCTHLSYSFNEEGGRRTLTGRPSVGVVGGVVCVATDLLFVGTVWLPIDVVPLQTFGGGVRPRPPKGKPPGGAIPTKSQSPG